LITTSRDAGPRIRSVSKQLASLMPGSLYLNRGRTSISEVISLSSALDVPYVLLFHGRNGNPAQLRVLDLKDGKEVECMAIVGLSVPTDRGSRPSRVNKLCLGKLQCASLRSVLTYVSNSLSEKCDAIVSTEIKGGQCKLIFEEKNKPLLWMVFSDC